MKHFAILTNIIAPYRISLFNGIAEMVKLDVLVCSDNELNRRWDINENFKFKIKRLQGITLTLHNDLNDYRFIYIKFSVLYYLIKEKPDKVIIGDASLTSYLTALCCLMLRIDYIWWNETLMYTPIRKGILGKFRSYSIKNANYHFVSGLLAKKFILNYGINENIISIIPDAVDNVKYINHYNNLKTKKQEIRAIYNFYKDDFIILYVGQFIERKNIEKMLDAYKIANKMDQNIKFILVGGGKLQNKIQEFKEENNLDGIIVLDFIDTEKLAELYSITNVLLLVSKSEPWGMVINEAMCFGVPVIASKNVGASADLINKKTGLVLNFDPNVREIVDGIMSIKTSTFNKDEIISTIMTWNNEIAIDEFVKCISK